MPARDPQTGKFVSQDGVANWSDVEVVSFDHHYGVEAAGLDGSTGFDGGQGGKFEGETIIELDDLLDRDELAHLVWAEAALKVWVNSTATADGTVRADAEILTSPTGEVSYALGNPTDVETLNNGFGSENIVTSKRAVSDSIDALVRPLMAIGHNPFSDGASGVGGGGSAGEDQTEFHYGANGPILSPRDEIEMAGSLLNWNMDDAGIHMEVVGRLGLLPSPDR